MKRRLHSALFLLLAAVPVSATTWHVEADGLGQVPVVSAAILAAQPGDTVLLAPGTYTGPGNTQLDFGGKDIVLMGAGPGVTVLDCQDSGQEAVRFHSGETRAAVLRDMTLRNNYHVYVPVGIVIEGASPTLVDLHLEDFDGVYMDEHWNYYTGAAIHCTNGSPLVIDVEVRDCQGAGSVYAHGGLPVFKDVLIEDGANGYASGGGMVFSSCAATATGVTVRNCTSFEGGGGAIACWGSPSPTFDSCRFEDNTTYSEIGGGAGGGGLVCFGGTPVLRRCVFLRNTARDGGGGLAAYDATPHLEDVLFVDCGSSAGGSAIYLQASSASLDGVTITGGSLWEDYHEANTCSAILCLASSPSLGRVIVAFNLDDVGLWTDAASAPTLDCCDFAANGGGNFGGNMVDPTGTNGNIARDPLFCGGGDPESALAPASSSPCAPANNDCGVLIGALPVGCELAAYSISGHIADREGQPLAGIAIDGLGYALNTDPNGDYSVAKLAGWSGTLTPRLPGYVFTPSQREYLDLHADQPAQDYLGERRTLHRVPSDHATLSEAFSAALSGDTILVAPGTYSGPLNRNLDFAGRELVVISEGGSAVTILDCGNAGRGFYLHSGQGPVTRVQGFTIQNGRTYNEWPHRGGGLYVQNSSPTLRDLRFIDCDSDYGGGLALEGSTTQADSLVAVGCTSTYDGAGIFVTGSTVTLRALTLIGNAAAWGGGGLALKNASTVVVERAVMAANSAGAGGAVYCRDQGNTLIISCSDAFANTPENYGHCPDPTGAAGNLAVDPLLCEPAARDFTLHADSPCAAANTTCGVNLGYFGVGCAEPLHTIAGHVLTPEALPLPGVPLSGAFYALATDSAGAWSFRVRQGWSGSVAAALAGYALAPAQFDFANVQQDWLDQDFIATRVTLRRVPQELPTIQAAIVAVAQGDTILVAPGTYAGPGFIDIELLGKDVSIIGEGGAAATVLDCANGGRGFWVHQGETAAALIQGFTVLNGRAGYAASGGGLHIRSASPTLRDLIVTNCTTDWKGGGMYFTASQSLLEDLIVRGCTCSGSSTAVGGGIACDGADITLRRVLLAGNHAGLHGGGLYCWTSSPLIEHVTFVDNSSGTGGGGGLAVGHNSSPTLRACLVAFNSSSAGGGVYVYYASAHPSIVCSDVVGNEPDNYGGYWQDQTGIGGNISESPIFCDAAGGDYTLGASSPCLPLNNDCQVQMGAYGEGCTGTAAEEAAPAAFAFAPPQPNPFNPKTTLRFALPRAAAVDLAIFDVSGRRVRRLLAGERLPAGHHALDWDGRDEAGRALPSGVYFARFAAGGFTAERKLVLLR